MGTNVRGAGGCGVATPTPCKTLACAAIIATDSWSLLLVNVYMPYEGDEQNTEEYTDLLLLIENIMVSNSATHVIVGGDFNLVFSRNKVHTASAFVVHEVDNM